MKKYLILLSFFFSVQSFGQFYYKDLVDAVANTEKMKVYLANKVSTVTATGFDARGAKSPDYYELQEVFPGKSLLKVSTRNGQSVVRIYYRFDPEGRLASISDSTNGIKSRTSYQYTGNNLTSVKTESRDSLNDFTSVEEHVWIYNTAGKPEKMFKIVNRKDSTEYSFSIDEKGNVTDEQLVKRGVKVGDPVYYYYDEENMLTDIARYSKRAKKILPDFMFEYDEQNRVIQKITTLSTLRPDYLTWRYIFNEKGLKTKEALFNKQKELTGKIEYTYNFQP
ncbi:hypothetical protein LZZ85_20985 [Terrimonas sp. NA20]|uniref:DUF4595 domain-containing protein n=1 Tax=Terrimonas ginsenosidimutans TaxID=2908004 RepID=A0ABS9KX18_9BACT|nr:hypothetical protein [Terrimonas ginsenosidimutans]MCG2616787.1 hypothetical protein [Terrimonas ginsenosidimutans]